jgi:ribosomal protein S18 acetylase RimI-like enzyme
LATRLDLQVVDLPSVALSELEELWRCEGSFWRTRLLWDISDTIAAMQCIQRRGGLQGKAVRADGRLAGYASYGVAGRLGVISGLALSPEWRDARVGEALVQASIDALRSLGVSRIASRFVAIDEAWLVAAFERQGFRTYWREFLRRGLHQLPGGVRATASVFMEPWRQSDLHEATAILQQAYAGGVDAEIDEQYGSLEGCQTVLDEILNQGSCGPLIAEASGLARQRGRGLGFVLVTEISPHQAHLTQIAVVPACQQQGVGRGLLDYSLRRLTAERFETLSLIVSRANARAFELYQRMGFAPVLSFPVWVWEA